MNILFNIGVYMLASSSLMIGFVWIKYIKHTQSAEYGQMSEINDYADEAQSSKKSIAA